ncbi:MAG: hypothetical protein AB1716_08605 [Planctomycetota bacterium]
MDVLAVVLRILHIGGAVVLGGALVYQLTAVQPALRRLDGPARDELAERLIRAWSVLLWAAVAVLLASGLLNYLLIKIPEYRPRPYKGAYHGLIGLKILAGLALFHAGAMLALPFGGRPKTRAQAPRWLAWGTLLLAVIIVLGAVLRYLPSFYASE